MSPARSNTNAQEDDREEEGPVLFYSDLGPKILSNFARTPIVHRGRRFATVEHAYQSYKFIHPAASPRSKEYGELVRRARTPNISRVLGVQRVRGGYAWRTKLNETIRAYADVRMRADWDEVKDGIMRELLVCKFTQNPRARAALLATGSREIREHTARDTYWADGGDGSGKNMLGKLLVSVRDAELKRQAGARRPEEEEEEAI